jgi:putative phage-type endonuclease
MQYIKKPQSRDEWLEIRKAGIGGSEVAAILGLSPWSSPVDVWLDKTGRSEPKPENDAMRWGNLLEGIVAKEYAMQNNATVRNYGYMIFDEETRQLANVDRLVSVDGSMPSCRERIRTRKLLEIKTAGFADWAGVVPEYYQLQVQQYLALTGCDEADVCCLFMASRKLETYRIEADQNLHKAIAKHCRDWWDRHVIADVPPPPRSYDDVKALFPKHYNGEVLASEEQEAALSRYIELAAEIKGKEAEQDKIKMEICRAIGESEALVGLNGKPLATWKQNKAGARVFSVKARG